MPVTAPNPFFHRGPVRDPTHFFGRERETTALADLLRQGQSVAINGPRRLGKTSLLFHLGHPDVGVTHALGPAATRWVYLDGGMLDGLGEEWFYGAVDRALGGEADAIPYSRFVDRVRALAAERVRLILAIDEFELVAMNPHFGRELFNRLRGLMGQFGMRYDDLALEKMWRMTAGHPYFLQMLCHGVVRRHNRTRRSYVTISDVNAALDEIVTTGEAHLVYLWTESTPDERLVLGALSRLLPSSGHVPVPAVVDYLAERGDGIEQQAVSVAMERLARRDILTTGADLHAGRAKLYGWRLGLLGLWVERHQALSRVADGTRQ